MSNINPADYRSGSQIGRATAAQAAQGRAYQAQFAKMYGIWYRPGYSFVRTSAGGRGHGHKPKKPKVIHQHRHNEALAAGATVDPFRNRGAARGF